MKKLICFILIGLMIFSLAACGGKNVESKEWSRQGTFEDENGNYLLLSPSDTEGYEGWAVTFMEGEDAYGWIIQQEGNTLRGNLNGWDENENPFIVTISEEGEDGLKLEVEGGDTYHFTPADIPEAAMTVTINTEGLGQVAYAEEGEEPEFSDEFPTQSTFLNLAEPATYVIGAKADEGWEFVKWTKDGKDYSTDEIITAELAENADFVAVFEPSSDSGESGIKSDPEEAEYQIEIAMQHLIEEAYGDDVTDARIYVEKIYTAKEEQADELLSSYNLSDDEVAFEVKYELHPAEGVDVNQFTAATGVYDEESGWIIEKYNVGILRPNPEGDPAYVITDFGTAF